MAKRFGGLDSGGAGNVDGRGAPLEDSHGRVQSVMPLQAPLLVTVLPDMD
jgi:hypothetical protein